MSLSSSTKVPNSESTYIEYAKHALLLRDWLYINNIPMEISGCTTSLHPSIHLQLRYIRTRGQQKCIVVMGYILKHWMLKTATLYRLRYFTHVRWWQLPIVKALIKIMTTMSSAATTSALLYLLYRFSAYLCWLGQFSIIKTLAAPIALSHSFYKFRIWYYNHCWSYDY